MELDAPTRGGHLRDVAYGTGQQPRGRPHHPQGGAVTSGIRPAKIPWTGPSPQLLFPKTTVGFDGSIRRATRPAQIVFDPDLHTLS